VRDNILFGLHYDAAWYSEVLDVCALTEDLSLLASGDQTEIGERGINLSGGQKARVSIARAVYSRADIILLDDPLAAVDRHVGDVIFERCVRRALKGKTVILVTNQLERLERVDRVVVLRDGSITESGTHAELMQARGDFADLMERRLPRRSREAPPWALRPGRAETARFPLRASRRMKVGRLGT